ncbi:MAG: helix-turn-helix transcriptional regulator [Oscillospiraceae bacterium]|nr:helix-turn-helix transcriptional regulator [Oscillospiraceae bacterium]
MDQFLMVSAIAVFIENRLKSGFEYTELEKATGFSLPHIRAVYAKLTGKSLSRYVLSRRIANAAFEIVHTEQNILDIATKYGFSNPDSFTRAFRRITGVNPNEFRKRRMPVGRVRLSMGVFGVSVEPENNHQNIAERIVSMNNSDQKRVSDGSVVLYGVPKIHYGAFGGITPLPISMKAAANYMGIELDYTEAIVNCGMAFRLTWNETCWDGGNVGDIWTFDDPSKVFRCAIESLGCEYNLIGRASTTKKSEFLDFIRAKIDNGIPVIVRGVIGPPEAGIITGYRENGDTLLGWSVFQEYQEFAGNVRFDESGYYITDQWWENKDTNAVMSYGEPTGERFSVKTVVENAIEVMTPRRKGNYAKAGYAYDAWKKAILDESQFNKDMVSSLLVERLMCQGDAMDCLVDGRKNAYIYFKKLTDENREQPLYGRIAEQFAESATQSHKMFDMLEGYERGEKQMQLLAKRETREEIGNLIDKCKAADEKALALMKRLIGEL